MDLINTLIRGDCREHIAEVVREAHNPVIVTDPPFNIGYHYKTYKDRMKRDEYLNMLYDILSISPSVVVHYPETLYAIAIRLGQAPERVVSWVYNSNTARQHRDVAFFGVKPDFNRVRQPYKDPSDKRVQEMIAKGKLGAKLYDYWNINQVKNVSKEKTAHPCQMPLEVMKNIVGILPDDITVIDPFMGSGTTGVACAELGVPFIGIEIDEEYYNIAKERITQHS